MPKYRVTRGKIGRREDGALKQYGPGLMDIDPATGKEVDMSVIEMTSQEAARYMSQLEEMPGQYEKTTANVEVEEIEPVSDGKVVTGQLEPVGKTATATDTTEKTTATTTTSTPTSGTWNGDTATIGDHTAPDVIAYIQASKSADAVMKVVDAEKSGRNRKGIIAAGEDKLSSFK